jgi:DNA-binding NarL/FixJ family response regulator
MPLKIFIADDSELLVEKLDNILSDIQDIKIIGKAYDALTAADLIKKLIPDVVILDIHLNDGSGIEILKQIKKNNPSTIVIIFTNHSESDYRKVCLKASADYFLDKSIEFEKTLDICKNLIQLKKDKKNYI